MFCKIVLTAVQDRNIQWHIYILTDNWLQYAASCLLYPVIYKGKDWKLKMAYFAGTQALKGLFFISTFKGKEILETEAERIKDICARKNIFIEDIAVEPHPLDMMDIDRPYIRGLISHKCELKQAILVKLLYETHHSGFFGTVFFLTGNVNIFYLQN